MIDYKDLDRLLIEYKLNIFRYDAYVRSIVNKHLSDTQKALLARVAFEDFATIRKSDLNALLKDIRGIIDENYARIGVYLESTAAPFFATAVSVEAAIYNQWLGRNIFTTLPKYKLDAIKVTPFFQGNTLNGWWERQTEDMRFKMSNIIRNGAAIGESEYSVAKEIRHEMGVSQRQAATIVRTANAEISNQAQAELIKQNKKHIESKQQISTLDSRTTDICRSRDLLKWTLDNEPIGHNRKFIDPPLHFNCRSIIRMNIKGATESTRSAEFGPVSETLDYEAWLKEQSDSYQDKVLGKKRAQWFREGKIGIRDMVNQDDRKMTLEQLRSAYGLS